MRTGFIHDRRYLLHDTGVGHPERAERLRAIVRALEEGDLWEKLEHPDVIPADTSWIELAHPRSHIARVEEACRAGVRSFDADTIISSGSYDVALLAVGGVLGACDGVMERAYDVAFCAVRPPGHHAERARAMGFCLFGNVAVAARYLQRKHGLERIAIVDWDVHHGNGTQEIFEEDPTVLYVSLHQHPLYPGTGAAHERGVGAGEGFTLNIPLPPGCGDDEYRIAFEKAVAEVTRFAPDFIIVSAGFDAHRDDPLANMEVTEEGFRLMMRRMLETAIDCCDGRLVAVLEGGYDLDALGTSVREVVREMLEFER